MKKCPKCKLTLDYSDFKLANKKPLNLSSWCRNCSKVAQNNYYAENKDKWRERRNIDRDKNREILRKAKEGPCLDCKGSFPFYAMDFDHVDNNKVENVGRLISYSTKTLLAEIAKCELICANCHRIRTWKRSQVPFV